MEQKYSFSKKLKTELSRIPYACADCIDAQLYGMLLFGKCLQSDPILFSSEHKPVVDRFVADLVEATASILTVRYVGSRYRKDGTLYLALVEHPEDAAAIRKRYPDSVDFESDAMLQKDCCRIAFIRGAFLACGSVIDPNKEYHLEFVISAKPLADAFLRFLVTCGVQMKRTERKGAQILYLKESEQIEDLITLMGAYQSSLEIMEIKVVKDVRNKINRATNCETANLSKTVNASAEQISAIRWIEQNGGIGALPEELRELARLRLDNPEMSLRELGALLSEPISRSGVNHRMQRILAFAAKHKENNL